MSIRRSPKRAYTYLREEHERGIRGILEGVQKGFSLFLKSRSKEVVGGGTSGYGLLGNPLPNSGHSRFSAVDHNPYDPSHIVFMDYRDHVKHKVVDVVRTVPLDLLPEDTPEAAAEEKKNDMLADKQVRHILWTGLGLAVVQLGVPFRLTFWLFSLGCGGAQYISHDHSWDSHKICLIYVQFQRPKLPRSTQEAIPLKAGRGSSLKGTISIFKDFLSCRKSASCLLNHVHPSQGE
ncbi:hypothetical protein OROMI_016406 [Orobanche minor]